MDSPEGYYRIALAGNAVTYTLTASPLGPQVKDSYCQTLSLDSTGATAATGSDPDRCW